MKKRVLFYLVGLVATFSMQSCVTNYVVSTPTTYNNAYKADAKLASIDNKKLELAKQQGLDKVYVHAFLDGRDVAPDSGVDFVKELQEKISY